MGKHFLWKPTLKTLFLPGAAYITLFTSVTIYVPEYDFMILFYTLYCFISH